MLKSIGRNHMYECANRSTPIIKKQLSIMKARLDLDNPRHTLFWAVATMAFHAMAKLGEVLLADQSRVQMAICLQHLVLEKGDNGPYALITLLTSKTHNPNIEAVLS